MRRESEPESEAAVGRREAGKAERRKRIIHAARDLIRETGNVGLSMRALAARAGVSLATPYNLFGSKRAIVLAVLDDVREYHDRFAHLRSTDPLERLFGAVDIAIDFLRGRPAVLPHPLGGRVRPHRRRAGRDLQPEAQPVLAQT
jgi:AcrR family transcriptional regulator